MARTDHEIAELFQIELKQAQRWLRRAVELGRARKLNKPVRYIAAAQIAHTLPLFDPDDPSL